MNIFSKIKKQFTSTTLILLLLLMPTLVLGWGIMQVGNSAGIAYDLQALWTAANATFSNTQVLDTSGEGVSTGALTVVETSSGSVKIVSNELELTGDGADYSKTGVTGEALTRAQGKALFATMTTITGSTPTQGKFGFATSEVIADNGETEAENEVVFHSTGLLVVDSAGVYRLGGTFAAATDYQVAIVLGNKIDDDETGAHTFIKGGIYTDWTLLWVDTVTATATIYPMIGAYTAGANLFDNVLIPTNVLNVNTMFQPNFLDTFTGDNDDNLGGHVPEVIAGVDGVQTLGSDLLDGWDFTSGWTESTATILDADSFITTAGFGYIQKSSVMPEGKVVKVVVNATASSGEIRVLWGDLGNIIAAGASINGTYYAADGGRANHLLLLGSSDGATIDVTTLELYEVTNGWQPQANTWTIQSNTANNDPTATEVNTTASAVSDPNGNEADSVGDFVQTGLDAGGNTFDSDTWANFGIDAGTGDYAIRASSTDTPTSVARTSIDLETYCSVADGERVHITFDVRHDGTSVGATDADWISCTAVTAALGSYVDNATTYIKTDTSFTTVTNKFTHDYKTRYFGFRELNNENDGGVYFDNLSVKTIPLNEQFISDDLGITQGIFDVDITIPNTTDDVAGLVLCLDSASAPVNFIQVFFDRATGKIECWKKVGADQVNLFKTTTTYSAGATLRCVLDYVTATDDVKLKVYYNGALVNSEQTIEDNTIAGNTRHGMMNCDPSNSLDNFTVHNRTDSNWDAEITSATGAIY